MFEAEIDKTKTKNIHSITIGDLNTFLSAIYWKTRQKISKAIEKLNSTI